MGEVRAPGRTGRSNWCLGFLQGRVKDGRGGPSCRQGSELGDEGQDPTHGIGASARAMALSTQGGGD